MMRRYVNDLMPLPLYVSLGYDGGVINRRLRTADYDSSYSEDVLDVEGCDFTCLVADRRTGERGVLVVLKEAVTLSVVAHECYHAVSMFKNLLGVDDYRCNDEFGAYMTEWCYGCCMAALTGRGVRAGLAVSLGV